MKTIQLLFLVMKKDLEVKEEDMKYEDHGNDDDEFLIPATGLEIKATTKEDFQGVRVGSRSQFTVPGLHEAQAYCRNFCKNIWPPK